MTAAVNRGRMQGQKTATAISNRRQRQFSGSGAATVDSGRDRRQRREPCKPPPTRCRMRDARCSIRPPTQGCPQITQIDADSCCPCWLSLSSVSGHCRCLLALTTAADPGAVSAAAAVSGTEPETGRIAQLRRGSPKKRPAPPGGGPSSSSARWIRTRS